MHELAILIKERLISGLQRKSVTTCSRWAEKYRIMGKPFPGKFTFKYHPWLRAMHDCNAEKWVGQKAAQVGFTETALNRVLFKIDIESVDCLYLLPAAIPDARDFSSGRFDLALKLSDHLTKLFSDVKNVGHKRAGSVNLYIRGSRSKSGLKSIPVGLIIFDELEEMNQDNIPLATERQAGQIDKQTIALSTPRVDGQGINIHFRKSTQDHFYFNCPGCSKLIELQFPENIVITAESLHDSRINDTHLICNLCKAILPHQSKHEWLQTGRWVPSRTDTDVRGFYVNQLYSSTVSPKEIAEAYLTAQTNEADEQQFYNSKLGVTHSVKGSRINDEDIDRCVGSYRKGTGVSQHSILTLGVDQGKWLHYEINSWSIPTMLTPDINLDAKPKIIDAGRLEEFEQLDELMVKWGINYCVIDAQPEKRKALEFAYRFHGRVALCYYGRGVNNKQIHKHTDEPMITVDRTSWLDLSLGRFRRQAILLPVDIGMEYKNHIKAPIRSYEKDKDGNAIGRYVKADADQDHHAHARNYAEIALPLAAGIANAVTIRSPR